MGSSEHPTDVDATTILAQARAACGGARWDSAASIEVEGTIGTGGLSGPYAQVVALADGRSATHYALGPMTVARGFDGTTAWQRAATGEVMRQDAEAAAQMARTDAWLNARGYLFPSRWEVRIEALGAVADEGHDHVLLTITPAGGQPVTLWFDRSTGLLDRIVLESGGRATTRRFSDYRDIDGALLPHRIVTGSGDARFDFVTVLDRIRLRPDTPESVFDIPVQVFDDCAILDDGDGRRDAATTPMTLVNHHVYLPITINGQVLQVMLDTGGMNLLTPGAAARAGLVAEGAVEARGPGDASVGAGFARVDRLEIGDAVVLERQLFRVLPFPDFEQVEGTAFDGAIGVEVFKRFVVGIDYARSRIRFDDPTTFVAPAGSTALPITFHGHFPTIAGNLDGLAGQFWLDTGNRNALTLWAPFIAEHALLQRYAATDETTIGWGVGGRALGHLARGGAFTLGGIRLEAPLLTLKSDGGATAGRGVAGNVGGELLQRFAVSFDYTRQLVHLAPGARIETPFEADRSGLWINRGDTGFVVMSVLKGDPANAAGVQVGDVITHVDQHPAASIELAELRRRLRDPATGDSLPVRLLRDGEPRAATLRLRDLVPGARG